MKCRGQVKEGSLLIITEIIRAWLAKIKNEPLGNRRTGKDEIEDKFSISFGGAGISM